MTQLCCCDIRPPNGLDRKRKKVFHVARGLIVVSRINYKSTSRDGVIKLKERPGHLVFFFFRAFIHAGAARVVSRLVFFLLLLLFSAVNNGRFSFSAHADVIVGLFGWARIYSLSWSATSVRAHTHTTRTFCNYAPHFFAV